MIRKMYDVEYHLNEKGIFSHCTVEPIQVLREGVLPGCYAVSITAKDKDGRKFNGNPEDFYSTEEEAWEWAKVELGESIISLKKQMDDIQKHLEAQIKFLESISK